MTFSPFFISTHWCNRRLFNVYWALGVLVIQIFNGIEKDILIQNTRHFKSKEKLYACTSIYVGFESTDGN